MGYYNNTRELKQYIKEASKKRINFNKLTEKQRYNILRNNKSFLNKTGIDYTNYSNTSASKNKREFDKAMLIINETRRQYALNNMKDVEPIAYCEVKREEAKQQGNKFLAQKYDLEIAKMKNLSDSSIRKKQKKLTDLFEGKDTYKNKKGLVIERDKKDYFDTLVKDVNKKRKKIMRDLKKQDKKTHDLIKQGLNGLNGCEDIQQLSNILTERNFYQTKNFRTTKGVDSAILDMEQFLSSDNPVQNLKNDQIDGIMNIVKGAKTNRLITPKEYRQIKARVDNLTVAQSLVFANKFWDNINQFDSGGDISFYEEIGEVNFNVDSFNNLLDLAIHDIDKNYI